MKTLFAAILSLGVLAGLAGCTKENTGETPDVPSEGKLVKVTFSATQEGTQTRTAVGSDGSTVNWKSGDAISVFDGVNNVEYTTEDDGSAKATFNTKNPETKITETETYMALYPYQKTAEMQSAGTLSKVFLKSNQTAVAGSFDPTAALMVAQTKSNSLSLSFKHVVGYVKVTAPFDCKKISLVSNSLSDKLAGEMSISLDEAGEPVATVAAANYNRASVVGDIKAGETYYIAVIPVTLSSGFKLIFTDTTGDEKYRESNSANILTIVRNHVISLGNLEETVLTRTPYVTFSADAEQTFKMTLANGTGLFMYSVGGGEWQLLESGTDIKFGGPSLGTLRLRGISAHGTSSGRDEANCSMISFGNSEVKVKCTGDIRTLIHWENYKTVDTKQARFCKLFTDCSVLLSAPELPSMDLSEDCYYCMFYNCGGLVEAPLLPATTLSKYCYDSMFTGCTALTTVQETLEAETLPMCCYRYMFSGCTSLGKAPEIKAKHAGGYSCYNMFSGCINLKEVPTPLPATELEYFCYTQMFSGCTSLETAPRLPATTLASNCYQEMFYGCTSLKNAPDLSATFLDEYCCQSMFSGCTSLAKAPALPAQGMQPYCYQNMFSGCTNLTEAPILGSTNLKKYCYAGMFSRCKALETAPNLLAENMKEYCYAGMFSGCNALKVAPSELPASELAEGCYMNMFTSCTNLTSAPEIKATQMAESSCSGMFSYCGNLTQAPTLNAMKLAKKCYSEMFLRCTNLTNAPKLPATDLAPSCYNSMFHGCTSLEVAPEIEAKTLAESCCQWMFEECTSLKKSPELKAEKLVKSCYYEMFQFCSALSEVTIKAKTLDDGITIKDALA